ncbi:hypothetical protein CC79DRAFT_627490 [Sarocladium strictum]
MQRVSAFLPSWEKRNSNASAGASSATSVGGGNGGGGGLFGWPHRSSSRNSTASNSGLNSSANSLHRPAKLSIASINSNARVQREAFWPTTLDEECDKAARILKSFCGDGYLAPLSTESAVSSPTTEEPKTPTKIMKKIPRRIIQNAAGIAVFTCMRSGLWMTGSGGSGILIARKSDGTWSPPSGIMLHTPTLSFVIGVDIYDCILVVSDLAALEAIIKPRVTLGEDVGLASGQSVACDSADSDFKWTDPGATVLTYLKARGQHQHVNLSGCILTERANENERFYGSEVSQMDILAGNVGRYVEETKPLFEVIKMAEGRTDYDSSIIDRISAASAPGDALIASPKSKSASSGISFGVPDAHDPDPFGVLALEMAGLEIREAGSRVRPTSSQMNINSAISSPTTNKFPRQSVDTFLTRSNRGSYMSTHTVKSQVTDVGTQTANATPETTPSPGQQEASISPRPLERDVRISEVEEEQEAVDYTAVDMSALKHISSPPSIHSATSVDLDTAKSQPKHQDDDADKVSKASSVYDKDTDSDELDDSDGEDDFSDEEPVVFEVAAVQPARPQQVASRVMQAKGSMVTIPKRLPPPLPMRNPGRRSRLGNNDMGGETSGLRSPLRQEFGADAQDDLQPEAHAEVSKSESMRLEVPVEDASNKQGTSETPAKTEASDAVSVVPTKPDLDAADDDKTRLADDPKIEENADKSPSLAHSRTSTDTTGSMVDEKHASSIFTGPTEGRTSLDRSSVTTPTSERPFSVIGESIDDDTPKKLIKAEESQADETFVAARMPLQSSAN